MRADLVARRENAIEIVTPDDMSEDQYTGEQAKSAGRRYNQSHARAIPRLRCLVPIADQQKGKEAGQLPEENQLDQVAR